MGTAGKDHHGGSNMTVSQLDILQPKRTWQNIAKAVTLSKRSVSRNLTTTKRSLLAKLRSQYMLTNAFTDTRRTFLLNEDIILASIIIIVILNFSATSVIANTLYVFMLSATVASELSGVNLMLLAAITLSVLAISLIWVSSFMQNLLATSFMEALTRKQNKSLRLTIRRSLARASQTACSWLMLAALTFVPAGLIMLSPIVAAYLTAVDMTVAMPYFIAAGTGALVWVIWTLANFTLFPYVVMFGRYEDLKDALSQSRQLVKRKGRLFILSGYILFTAAMGLIYLLATAIQTLTSIDANLIFLLLSAAPISLGNVVLTILYRKRKLARS